MFIFRVWQARHTSKHSRPPEVHPSLKGHYITTDHITVRITWGCSAGLDRNFAWRFFSKEGLERIKKKKRERKEAHWRGEEQITRKRKRAKILQVMVVLGWSKAVGLFAPTVMASETSCDDVTVMDSSFPTAGRVRELREVWSSLVVQTVHPILID